MERGPGNGAPPPMAEQHIKVTRPFFLAGVRREVGAVFPVDAKFAAELRTLRKAEIVPPPLPKPAAKAAPKET